PRPPRRPARAAAVDVWLPAQYASCRSFVVDASHRDIVRRHCLRGRPSPRRSINVVQSRLRRPSEGDDVARHERPVDPDAGPLQAFAHDLRTLRAQAGSPTYRALAKTAGYSATTLSEAAGGVRKPSLD